MEAIDLSTKGSTTKNFYIYTTTKSHTLIGKKDISSRESI